jgi:hypothetical protein
MEEIEMKKINKRIVDWCIELTRLYWGGKDIDTEILTDRIETAKKAEINWFALINLLDGILAKGGFNPEASNLEIYLVLRLLGWEVADEEVEESESL